jgi:hypothetical protein
MDARLAWYPHAAASSPTTATVATRVGARFFLMCVIGLLLTDFL